MKGNIIIMQVDLIVQDFFILNIATKDYLN